MASLLLVGASGFMGRQVIDQVKADPGLHILAGIAHETDDSFSVPLHKDFSTLSTSFDGIIDFSHPTVVDGLLDYLEDHPTPTVICTTGLEEEQIQRIDALSKKMPLFRSGNMSLGIHGLLDLVARAKRLLPGFDIEIVEKHHRRKVDAPSGTAKMLLESLSDDQTSTVYGRQGGSCKRSSGEIGVHALRGGTIVGEHQVHFAGESEVITLTHQAESRAVFASGALAAIKFLLNCEPGLYEMSDLLKEKE